MMSSNRPRRKYRFVMRKLKLGVALLFLLALFLVGFQGKRAFAHPFASEFGRGPGFGIFDGGGWPTPTPTETPIPTAPPTETPTQTLGIVMPTDTPQPAYPYPPAGGFLPDTGLAVGDSLDADAQGAATPRSSPNLALLALPFVAAAVILGVIVFNWMRRARG